jgi:hypothetical protein
LLCDMRAGEGREEAVRQRQEAGGRRQEAGGRNLQGQQEKLDFGGWHDACSLAEDFKYVRSAKISNFYGPLCLDGWVQRFVEFHLFVIGGGTACFSGYL